ncbi:MAG: hypothetical protein ACUVXA_06090 [Candidatus Jordarchaeum sp.]|uniref:hypothetical protein n=1 Tax=Candidatus Jordarchaeum sp. TaxID=2823881 RepID=UPI00404A2FAB
MRSRILIFIVILALILGITSAVYFQSEPTPTYPNTPFILYYFRYDYTVQSNGTATLSGLTSTVIWSEGYANPNTVLVAERNGFAPIQYSEVNLYTRETNTTGEHFLWWIPPWLPIGTPVNIGNNTGVIVSETELSVQQLLRNTKAVFYSGSDRTIIANYDANSGFLIQLQIKEGEQISIYQLQSTLGVSLGVSNYYYARVIFLCLFIPASVIFILMLPWPWRRWGQSLSKFLRKKV